ncbi:MAG TPA: hypothetical protein VIU65_00955 [Pyrinomonadaceae bacterium]
MNTRKLRYRWLISSLIATSILSFAVAARASSWRGIEPFVSKRADVERAMGTPATEGPNGSLNFAVAGGTVSVSFVDQNFVKSKKLRAEVEGTVLQIILQHESSSDTPESMNLVKNHDFVRDKTKDALIYRNLKEGIVYTFIGDRLRTTRYTFSEKQIRFARHGR